MLAIYRQYNPAHEGTLLPVALTPGSRVKAATIRAAPTLAETYDEGGTTKGVLVVARKTLIGGEPVGAHAAGVGSRDHETSHYICVAEQFTKGEDASFRGDLTLYAFAPAFLATVLIASITPGPSMLLALDHGVRHGPRRAVSTALGNVAATALQCGVSLAGLGVVLTRSAWFFTTLRHLGAAYLVYCGLKMIFSQVGDAPGELPRTGSGSGLFGQAFLVTLGNPKAIIFFSALFPQFIDERTLTPARASFMLASVLAITFACMMTYATLGGRIRALLARRRARRVVNGVFGLSFIGLGASIALDHRR